MTGVVGDDQFADRLVASIRDFGVDSSNILKVPKKRSGVSVALIVESGDSESVIVSGVNMDMETSFVSRALPEFHQGDVLVIQNEIAATANETAARLATEKGAWTLLNAAPHRELSQEMLELADVLVLNEVEAAGYSGREVTDAASAKSAVEILQAQCGAQLIIVTLGSQGLVYTVGRERVSYLAAHEVDSSDAHGAGDAFVGALAASIARAEELEYAVEYANAASAVTISIPYEERHTITREAVLDLIEERGGAQ
jgi:ribokinase